MAFNLTEFIKITKKIFCDLTGLVSYIVKMIMET